MSTTALIIIGVAVVVCLGVVLFASGGSSKSTNPAMDIAKAGRVIRESAYDKAWERIVNGMADYQAETQAQMISESVPRKKRARQNQAPSQQPRQPNLPFDPAREELLGPGA